MEQTLINILKALEIFEGKVPFMYLDNAKPPNVTVGIGCLLKNVDVACRLPFVNGTTNTAATEAEIMADFNRVYNMPGGLIAKKYKGNLYLQDDAIYDLGVAKLNTDFLPGLHRLCPSFDSFPEPCQAALIDMAWNLGMGGLAKFQKLITACNNNDWNTASQQCSVKTSRADRNNWRSSQFLAAV